MKNLKLLSNRGNAEIENNLSTLTSTSDSGDNENIFLIGLNIQGNAEILSANNSPGIKSKIPMFMLKIDANRLLSTKKASENISKNETLKVEKSDNHSNEADQDSEIVTYELESVNEKPKHTNLSYREEQVLKLIALGKTRKEIAEQLFLSISTINTYRTRILEKMNMKNNADLMRYAFKHKLVE
jgi:DNA-binding CsgD family transcriptional regulator